MGRQGSDAGSLFGFRRNGSVAGLDGIEEGNVRTAGEEALRVVWREFREVADGKVARVCGRPLVSCALVRLTIEHSTIVSRLPGYRDRRAL